MSRRVISSVLIVLVLGAPVACGQADKAAAKRASVPKPRPTAKSTEFASAGGGADGAPTSQPTTKPSLKPETETKWQSAALPLRSEPVAVKQGPAPLVYMTEGPGVFRLVDATTGQALADAFAKRQTIIRVTERYGVVYGADTLSAGPLPKGHQYTLYLLPDGNNVARQGVSRPKPK
jgi:hypothetical protein